VRKQRATWKVANGEIPDLLQELITREDQRWVEVLIILLCAFLIPKDPGDPPLSGREKMDRFRFAEQQERGACNLSA
jgi:hypothetical protein